MGVDKNTRSNYDEWAEHIWHYKTSLIAKGFTELEAFTLVKDLHFRLLESGIKPTWLKELN